jgi:hypothetical protein
MPIQYIPACICVSKQHEQALYDLLLCISGNALTFVGFHEVLLSNGLSDEFVTDYNNQCRDSGLQLNAELSYDLLSQVIQNYIHQVVSCTGGTVDWLVLAYAEIRGWTDFHKIEAAIAADRVLQNCAFIEQLP